MNKYETQLFEVAPWTEEVMQVVKELNDGSFMRGRTGWIRRGIDNPESIYEHSCKVGLAAYHLFGTEEAVAKGIVHDFGEIFEPDHIPWEVDPKFKQNQELGVMVKLKDILPNGKFWFDTWKEFEYRIGIGEQINELDKMCPSVQAINYFSSYLENNLEEFQPYALTKVKTPQLVEILKRYSIERSNSGDAYDSYFSDLAKVKLS